MLLVRYIMNALGPFGGLREARLTAGFDFNPVP